MIGNVTPLDSAAIVQWTHRPSSGGHHAQLKAHFDHLLPEGNVANSSYTRKSVKFKLTHYPLAWRLAFLRSGGLGDENSRAHVADRRVHDREICFVGRPLPQLQCNELNFASNTWWVPANDQSGDRCVAAGARSCIAGEHRDLVAQPRRRRADLCECGERHPA